MFMFSASLTIAAGIFYAAGSNTTGWAMKVCRYGDIFCVNPSWLLFAAALSLIWACFMRVDRL